MTGISGTPAGERPGKKKKKKSPQPGLPMKGDAAGYSRSSLTITRARESISANRGSSIPDFLMPWSVAIT